MPRSSSPSAMVGLDIGADSIKVAEAKFGKDGITVTALGIARTPEGVIENEVIVDPKGLASALKTLLTESGIKTKQVTSSVAGQSQVVIRVIEVPKMAKQELAETMKWEVERQVPFPPNEAVMDFQPLEKPNGDPDAQNMEVLLAVAKEQLVNSHIETLQAAGLRPTAIDIEPLAAGRALLCGNSGTVSDEVVAIVNIGASDTDLGIFDQGVLTFPSPPLSIAGISFTREVAENLGQTIDQAETTKKEYASVNLKAFSQPAPVAPADPQPASEPTQFDTSVGPGIGFASAFDFGEAAPAEPEPAPEPEAPSIAAEPASLNDFTMTVDGPVFNAEPAFDLPVQEPEPVPDSVPAGPSFDLDDVGQTIGATAADLTGEPEPAPAGPVFDLDDDVEPAKPADEPAEPSYDLSDADQHADPGEPAEVMPVAVAPSGDSVEDRVFQALSGPLLDLANELRRSIEYYATRYSKMPERVYLCGGTAKMPHLDEFLSNELGVPVEVADPVKKLNVNVPGVSDRYLKEVAPMFSVAIGLAIRDMVA